jgi:hypothetical protein
MVINKEMEMNLNVADTITWDSAAGNLLGTIKKIFLAPAGNGVMTPWIIIEIMGKSNTIRMCASDSYLKMMKVEKVEIPTEEMKTVKNYITGEKVVIPADTPRCCDPSSELYWSM